MRTNPPSPPRTHRGTGRLFALPALIALVALAGCGSSNSSTTTTKEAAPATTPATTTSTTTGSAPASGSSAVSLSANPSGQLEYNTKTLSAKAGKVTINMTNMAPLEHDVAVESSSGQVLGQTPTFKAARSR